MVVSVDFRHKLFYLPIEYLFFEEPADLREQEVDSDNLSDVFTPRRYDHERHVLFFEGLNIIFS